MAYHIKSEANLSLYADDHQMYTTGPVFSKVRDSLEKEGRQAYAWYKDHYLLANKDKFQAMVMNPRNVETNSASLDVIIEDHAIANMDHIKLLRVSIAKDINFSKHIGEVCTKAGGKVDGSRGVEVLMNIFMTLKAHKLSSARRYTQQKAQDWNDQAIKM